MINVMQESIPFKKVAFSETPSKRDFKEFAEKVFEAVIVQALKDRMKACASKHSDSIKYCDILESLEENIHSLSMLMRGLVKKIEQYKLGELTKSNRLLKLFIGQRINQILRNIHFRIMNTEALNKKIVSESCR